MTTIGSVSEGDADTILEEVEEDYFPSDFMEYMLMEQLIRSGDADTILEVAEEDYFPSHFMEYMLMEQLIRSGDADTILEEVEEDYFPSDFMEYMLMEQLNWWRHKDNSFGIPNSGWVFCSQQDHEIEPSLSLDNCADFNPNVCPIPKLRDNIRLALHKLVESRGLPGLSLVQFWAATTTLEGRTKLTTQYQPFALGRTPHHNTIDRLRLCEYRMKMCRDYNFFYADAESGEEQQLGLPGHVFLHKSPEYCPDHVRYYSEKEYPQRDLALRCKIRGSGAVPVFEHSSQTCVGVLEMVSQCGVSRNWLDESFLRNMHDIFQEFGLQCFERYQACEKDEFSIKGEQAKGHTLALGLTLALKELKMLVKFVSEIHELPLAMTWVPCSACNGLRRCSVEFKANNIDLGEFLGASKCNHLRKGLVAERALSSPNMLYCSDITQLSIDEYPLALYARQCKLSGWFTICLQSVRTGNDIYVLEFFLSTRSKDDENILTTLSSILGTMEGIFKTFRLAPDKELGEAMSCEVIYFQNDQKFRCNRWIQATRTFSSLNSDPSSMQSSPSVANTRPGFQDANMVRIKAKYAYATITFNLSLPCQLVEFQQQVAKRLPLKAGTYDVRYKDELDELILIACDEDLQACCDEGNTSTVVFLEPKQTSLNPTN